MDKTKSQPLDLTHHFSKLAQRYTETAASQILAGVSLPDIKFQVGPGFPFAGNFPVDTLEGAIAKPRRFPLYPVSGVSLPSTDTERFTVPKVSLDAQSGDPSTEIDLATALQYQQATGYPSLAAFVNDWALNYQNQGKIPYGSPETLLTLGAADAWAKCLQIFVDPGDKVLVEEYVFTGARDQIPPFGAELVPVPMDDQGMSAKGLEHVLHTWNERTQGKRPHLMYTVTLGQNPTGAIMSISRKKDIYKLCRKYDILICEDDPYWSLQYDIPDPDIGNENEGDSFLSRLAPSYLTIDVDGRVLGLQTFTKVFAPGCRVGWIVAQPDFIEKLTFLTEGTTQNPSGFAEAALAQIITREWGIPGFIRWIEGLRVNYKTRRDVFCEELAEGRDLFVRSHNGRSHGDAESRSTGRAKRGNPRKRSHSITVYNDSDNSSGDKANGSRSHLKKVRIYDFNVPAGGMYVWVDVNIKDHPLSQPADPNKPHLSPEEIMLRLWNHLMSPPYLLLALPGSLFGATPDVKSAINKLRLTFAAVPAADCRRAARVFGEALKSFWEGDGWDLPSDDEMRKLAAVVKGAGLKRWAGHLIPKEHDTTFSKVVKYRFQALAGIDIPRDGEENTR